MSQFIKFLLITLCITLSACAGPGELFEPTTYGVRNSEWNQMSETQKLAERQFYMQEKLLDEQIRANNLLAEQNRELAKSNHENNKLLREKILLDSRIAHDLGKNGH